MAIATRRPTEPDHQQGAENTVPAQTSRRRQAGARLGANAPTPGRRSGVGRRPESRSPPYHVMCDPGRLDPTGLNAEVLIVTGARGTPSIDGSSVERFRASGFLVLRNWFDAGPLADEIDVALRDGLRPDAMVNRGSGGSGFEVVVMMCELTPTSLELLDRLAPVASQLLGREVVPGRAKGTRYTGST